MKKIDYIYRETKKFFGLWEKPFIQFCEEYFKDREDLIFCEIGVSYGDNAYSMLHFLPIKTLYLIDIDTSIIKPQVKNDKRVIIIEGKSQEVADKLPDNLDGTYVDGDHSFDSCYRDLVLYEKKTRVLGGHDFGPSYPGVVDAVKKFSKEKNHHLYGNLEKEYWMVI